MEENKDVYNQMDNDTREMIEVIAKVKIKEEYQIMEIKEKKSGYPLENIWLAKLSFGKTAYPAPQAR